ncbi:MAG TPA: hypothetical protein VGK73_03995 [Polyangiaceae bacterium]
MSPPPKSPKPHQTVPCHACSGCFAFTIEAGQNPTIWHSTPYCPAFEAVDGMVDALRFAERCDISIEPERAMDNARPRR